MFKYFIGHIYVLDCPPEDQPTQLNIEFPDESVGELDINKDSELLTAAQIDKIKSTKTPEMVTQEVESWLCGKQLNRLKIFHVEKIINSEAKMVILNQGN